MKLHSYWARCQRIYTDAPYWASLWTRPKSDLIGFRCTKKVQFLSTTSKSRKKINSSHSAIWGARYSLSENPSDITVASLSSVLARLLVTSFPVWSTFKLQTSTQQSEYIRLQSKNTTYFGSSLVRPFGFATSIRSYHSSSNLRSSIDSNNSKKSLDCKNIETKKENQDKRQLDAGTNPTDIHNSSDLQDPSSDNIKTNQPQYINRDHPVIETHLSIKDYRDNSLQEYQSTTPVSKKPKPTKQDFLASTKSSIGRLLIHIRWALFKQIRPLTTDDISAFFSWILVGNILWILLGTTTFFSILLYAINTVFAQEYIAEVIGTFVTKNTGITVVFENAIVPNWSDGIITFNNVFVSRRPNRGNKRVQKGSQAEAAAAAMSDPKPITDTIKNTDAGQYTQFDLTIDNISVTLSLSKWMNGGGIVKDVGVKGLRGVVDRRHVKFDPDYDPALHKHVHKPGDFEIENFKMDDALVTLYNPNGFRPFSVSIFNCELPRLRKHWLFYDILSANNMTGTYDNSLFTVHPLQQESVSSYDKSVWKKITRLRIDAVNIDHLNRGAQGPLSWIESGNVDLTADIMFPDEEENLNFAQVLRDIKASWSSPSWKDGQCRTNEEEDQENYVFEDGEWKRRVIHAETKTLFSLNKNPNTLAANKYMVIDLRIQLNNARAVVPLFTSKLNYVNSALIRPIVAFINSRETYIPINCRIIKKFDDFEGSWTVFDSRLMDDISSAVYDAFATSIMDEDARAMRIKKIGFWSLQLALQLFLVSLGAFA